MSDCEWRNVGTPICPQEDGTSCDACTIAALRAAFAVEREKVARLEALFQQTHGVHSDWVARCAELEAELAKRAQEDADASARLDAVDKVADEAFVRRQRDMAEEVDKR